ncbi:MAG TPA: hypothetical protein VIR63_03530 [Pontiella sp.]
MNQSTYRVIKWSVAVVLLIIFYLTTPSNHSEAEDVYDFALKVEQGSFSDQVGINRLLALPVFSSVYKMAQAVGYSGRAFPFMIFINRLLAVACLALFYQLALAVRGRYSAELATLLMAFSYGFWRYANEAETYMLAGVVLLSSWCLVLKNRWVLGAIVSGVGVLVHLLNLVPLLLVIPLFYLLRKEPGKAFFHGGLSGVVVVLGYGICANGIVLGELGAQHHPLEGGIGVSNLVRAVIAFGQTMVSGNFLFGFQRFQEMLSGLFPSRMLAEEFYMASKMPRWIPLCGIISLITVFVTGAWICGKAIFECGGVTLNSKTSKDEPAARASGSNPFILSCLVWFILYAVAVIRTEAGSPELWVLALIPFWLIVVPLLKTRMAGVMVGALFFHNLVGGLIPVYSQEGDYHVAKGRWLVENAAANDAILIDYEPIMIFYLDYFTKAEILNSAEHDPDTLKQALGSVTGNAYAVHSFFEPMKSMQVRAPLLYENMLFNGTAFQSRFVRAYRDEFGGIYVIKKAGDLDE